MIMDEKRRLLRHLNATYAKGVDAELALRQGDYVEEAKRVDESNDRLHARINKLRAEITEDWKGRIAGLIEEIKSTNGRLQDAIRDIENAMKVAERAVKVIGYLDKAIELAAKLL